MDIEQIEELAPTLKELKICGGIRDNTQLLGKLSQLFSGAINLQKLYLQEDRLAKLPPELWNLTDLWELEYDNSLISSVWKNQNGILFRESSREEGKAPIFVDLMESLWKEEQIKRDLTELNASDSNLEKVPNMIVQFENLKKIDLSDNSQIDSIDKVSDGVFGLPKLESLILTTAKEGKKNDEKYNKEEIAEIRKQRIQSLEEKLISEEKIRGIVDLLHMGKNKASVNLKEAQSRVDSLKEPKPVTRQQILYAKMLEKLKEAQEKA